MPRLCFISPSNTRRPEIYGLATHLPKKYAITILQPVPKRVRRGPASLFPNVTVRSLPARFFEFQNSVIPVPHFPSWLRELERMVSSDRNDLIHACDYMYFSSYLPWLVSRRHPRVRTTIVNNALIGLEYAFGPRPIDFFAKVYTDLMGSRVLNRYDKVISLYRALATGLERLGVSREKVEVIPNGVDIEPGALERRANLRYRLREAYGVREDQGVILSLGRLVSVKRVDLLLRAAKKLERTGLRPKVVVAGDGPQRANLEAIASGLGLDCAFLGRVAESVKRDLYTMADVFALPSRSEGLPTVALEASAAGVPTVASPSGGISDIVVAGENGFVVPASDTEEFSNACAALLKDQDLARTMGIAARCHVEQNFSWDSVTRKYELLFDALIS